MGGFVGSTVDLPPIPSHERQLELARRAHDGDQAALEEMLVGNLRLVLHWAKRHQGYGVDLEDLIQEGVFGLHRAIQKFDPDAGFRFSTYATWWIRQSLRRAIAAQGRTIRIPDAVLDAEAAAERLGEEHTPTPRVTASLDASYVEAGNTSFSDAFEDDTARTDELVERLIRDQDIRAAVDRLPTELAHVVRLRFGLDGNEPVSRDTVASIIGVGDYAICRLERKALAMLRADASLQPAG